MSSHSKYWGRKHPLLLQTGGGGKEPHQNTLEHSVLNKICPQEKLTRASSAGILSEHQSPTNLGEGRCASPAGACLLGTGKEMPNSSLLQTSCPI